MCACFRRHRWPRMWSSLVRCRWIFGFLRRRRIRILRRSWWMCLRPSKDYPFGFAMNIEDRIIRVRWSEGYDKPVPLKAGEVRKVTVDLIAAGNRFAKGHRIRVDISSSNFPYFDANPNTGERVGYSTHTEKALNSVYHDSRASVAGEPNHAAGDGQHTVNGFDWSWPRQSVEPNRNCSRSGEFT